MVKIAALRLVAYFNAMFRLTRQQQFFLGAMLLMLLVGWAVKSWRAAHPADRPAGPAAR